MECGPDDEAAPLSPLSKGTHPAPAVLLWSDSQHCAVSHGEELIPHWLDQGLAGASGVVSGERRKMRSCHDPMRAAQNSSLFCLIP